MSPDPATIILLPAYNEAATIEPVVRAVSAYGTVLVVDDGSTDGTGTLAERAGARLLRLETNRGYDGAMEAGFAEADRLGAAVVATFDADGQFDAAMLALLLEPLRSGRVDLVIGQRPSTARLAEALFGLYTRLRYGVRDILCGVKAYRITLYRGHGRFDNGRSVGTELALAAIRGGARFETVDVDVRPRQGGKSRFGQGLRANGRILTALYDAVWADLRRGSKLRPE
jgi:glycosyltransferase involved in cell wall biosynthesis